jgi:dUTP pyrophosphatase
MQTNQGRYLGGVLEIPTLLVDDDLRPPHYARPGDAGADLVARTGAVVAAGGGRALVPTGVRVAIPEGYAGFVQPRSGLAWRHGITLANSPGLIDAGYRDEIAVIVINTDPSSDFEIRRGDRIAQLVVQRVEQVMFRPVADLPASDRGLGGFGHTGR